MLQCLFSRRISSLARQIDRATFSSKHFLGVRSAQHITVINGLLASMISTKPVTMPPAVSDVPTFRVAQRDSQQPTVLGHSGNFWKWSKEDGFNLTHPASPTSDPIERAIKLQCHYTPVMIDPAKTALLIIDFQNFNVSKALGCDVQAYFDAEDLLLRYAIPAARSAGIQIVWITTGYSNEDIEKMDPGPWRTFGWHPELNGLLWGKLQPGDNYSSDGEFRSQKGIGDPIGSITLEDGTTVDAGGVMSRGSWNAWLHGRLADAYEQSKQTEKPDIHFYKNRSSGMCDKMTACTEYLETNNLRTLLFTGLNTDQCVMGTLQDAYSKGFDTIMLGDGCATNSPEYAQLSCEFNCMRSWGFLSSCKDLAEAAEQIPK